MKNVLISFFAVVLLANTSGCADPAFSSSTKNDMKQIGMYYVSHTVTHGAPPASKEEFVEKTPEAKEIVESGDYVIQWGYDIDGDDRTNRSSMVLAYHKDVPELGGFVTLADASAKVVTKEEFASMSKAGE
ncbi:MAG: hypothetical protein AAF483_30430 [Planctomycetota bacterium]